MENRSSPLTVSLCGYPIYNKTMTIHLLPPEVASQIAAGEVVERPASVVKELLENALDAGASFITIHVESGGQRLVEVSDDGSGIPEEEIALAVERHATSKLVSAEDLFHIATLGFRGEALASIGSVSRMTLTSRIAGSETGARIRVEGGAIGAVELVGVPLGTVVRVEDLFYNVPARRKFLKSETTERRVIDELVTRYALSYPRVRVHLRQDGRMSLQTSGKGDRREVLASLYGHEVARQMLEVLAMEEDLSISGFISPPSLTRANRREIIFFVNGRPVQDITLVTALLKAYHTYLMTGRYPLAILFLELPMEEVDVNVHPTKAEVRFRNPDKMFSGVQRAVRRALLAHTPVQGLEGQMRWSSDPGSFPMQRQPGFPPERSSPGWGGTPWEGAPETGSQPSPGGPPAEAPDRFVSSTHMGTPILRLVGQIASAYLVAEGPDGLYLIDQHAAHERVLFEQFMAQRESDDEKSLPSQMLLQPVSVEMTPGNARMLEEQLPVLSGLGFSVESFGHNTFLVRAIPQLLAGGDPVLALRAVVEDFEEDETPLKNEAEARIVARICKRLAVKAGQTLSPGEQASLLSDLEACRQPRNCPHGRPTMIHLSVDLLERQFGRRGPR